jgi:hypothetical protein
MNKREAFRMGRAAGHSCASWCDVPELGAEIPRHLDWVGYGTLTADNQRDVHAMFAHEAESNGRQYSPFEFTAHAFNEAPNSDALWSEYERGIDAGITANLRARYARARRQS